MLSFDHFYMNLTIFIVFVLGIVRGGYYDPEQVHLSWTENPGEMRVTYVTLKWVPTTNVAYRAVECSNEEEWTYVQGTAKWFNAGEEVPRFIYIHTVVIPSLSPV